MDLTARIKEFLLSRGADMAGAGRAESLSGAPQGYRPTDYLPAAKSFISFACVLNRGPVLNLPKSRNEYLLEFEAANSLLNTIGFQTARFLEGQGFQSMAVPATASIGDAVRLMGDVSQKHAAVKAGLGLFGINNLVLTREHGSRVRFGMVITEAELVPDRVLEEEICIKCGKCIEACPSGALSQWEESFTPQAGCQIDKEKCYHYIFVRLGGRRCGMCMTVCPCS